MTEFKPRKGSYIKERNGQFYYRRAIPASFQHEYGEKKEWNIRLEGRTKSDRISEAHAYAHQHNREMMYGKGARILSKLEESMTPEGPDLSVRLDFNDMPLPVGFVLRPFLIHRNGEVIETFKVALSRDPDFLRDAEKDGFIPMSYAEGEAQLELNKLIHRANDADNDDRREIAELKADRVKNEIDGLETLRGETVLSALPKWEKREKPRLATQAAHEHRIQEFVNIHGNLPLASITKRHIVDFVDHLETLTHKGKPMKATSMSNYLASVTALLNFAVSSDMIPFNPAHRVKPPKEHRPKIAQSWHSFSKVEVRNLISVATDIWLRRRVPKFKNKPHLATRKSDLITALHMLVWTGARPEEICQLRLADISLSDLTISITNDDSDDEPELRSRYTKNENSVRVVPIHSELAPIIHAHLDVRNRASNGPLLFPSFAPSGPKGRYGRTISQEWTKHLRAHVTNSPRKVLYSLRHSWKAESLAIGMPEHVRLALMGHGGENVAADRYAKDADWMDEKRRFLEMMDCVGK